MVPPPNPTPAKGNRNASPAGDADQRFRVLVETVKDYAIFMLDLEGRIRTWNVGAEIIKGYKASEIIGCSFEIFYPPEDRARGLPARLLAEAAAAGRVEHEGWRIRKDGRRIWMDVVITALHDASGQVNGYAKVSRDLTERRNAEEQRRHRDEELLRSEERFRLLVDAVEDYAIFMLDPTGRVATWNGGAERIHGYKGIEIVGEHFSRFRLEEDVRAGRCEQELEAAAGTGRHEEEGWRLRKDGTRFWASVVLTAIRDASGQLLGFAKVTRDLTQRRRLEQESMRRAAAEESVRLRDEFISIASHELKTPLTTLLIELRGMGDRMAQLEERTAKRFARAARNADRLAALIESLLDVSRISAGKLVLDPEPLDLCDVVAEAVDSVRGAASKAHCELVLNNRGPIRGSWDRLRVEQVLTNLLSNALKYGAGRSIEVSTSRQGASALIEVADRGPGIPEEDLQRIFGRFERAAPVRHYGGLGLGLYVSRTIVESQGGVIGARNRRGGGARFTVCLPLAAQRQHLGSQATTAR
jgi:PAS domain S-box-containing protein